MQQNPSLHNWYQQLLPNLAVSMQLQFEVSIFFFQAYLQINVK